MLELLFVVAIVGGGVFLWRKLRGEPGTKPATPPLMPPRYGPDALTGHMRELSLQAQAEIAGVLGPAGNPRGQQTYLQVGDFLAAMRYYRSAVSAAYSDELIEAGLSYQPGDFIEKFVEAYKRVPMNSDRDQAIAILQHVMSSQAAGVIVAMARLTINKLKALGY